jgi:NAD(P)-dependent dehydrogenase (short-subunit alcohol dehydrogenase family)
VRLQSKVLLLVADNTAVGQTSHSGIPSNEAAIALECAREGASIAIAAKNRDAAEALARLVEEQGGKAHAVVLETLRLEDFERAVASAVATFGKVDLLINLIGAVDQSNVLDLSVDAFDKGLHENVEAQFLGIKAVLPQMIKAGGGGIVNISSVSAIRCGGAGIGYETGKAALLAMTRNVAVSAAPMNVRINSILPGVFDSAAFRAAAGDRAEAFGARVPMHRLGSPQEFAKAIVFFLSDDASYITGATLVVDGGLSIPV